MCRLSLVAAVGKRVLTIRQAAYFADLRGPSVESVQLLGALASATPENPKLQQELVHSALAAVTAIHGEETRAEALAALAPNLPPELVPDAFAAAQAISDETAHATALTALAPHLPTVLLSEAFAADRR